VTNVSDIYSFNGTLTAPSFGTGGAAGASTVLGDTFGIQGERIYLAANSPLTGTLSSEMTFSGASFASLGLTQGVYDWIWDTDRLRLTVGAPATIPVPASLALLMGGLGGLLSLRRRRSTGWRRACRSRVAPPAG
jgi:predicted transporter